MCWPGLGWLNLWNTSNFCCRCHAGSGARGVHRTSIPWPSKKECRQSQQRQWQRGWQRRCCCCRHWQWHWRQPVAGTAERPPAAACQPARRNCEAGAVHAEAHNSSGCSSSSCSCSCPTGCGPRWGTRNTGGSSSISQPWQQWRWQAGAGVTAAADAAGLPSPACGGAHCSG